MALNFLTAYCGTLLGDHNEFFTKFTKFDKILKFSGLFVQFANFLTLTLNYDHLIMPYMKEIFAEP